MARILVDESEFYQILRNVLDKFFFAEKQYQPKEYASKDKRGIRIEKLAEEFNIEGGLDAKQLSMHLFGPDLLNEPIKLSKGYLTRLCQLLLDASEKYDYKQHVPLIEKFREKKLGIPPESRSIPTLNGAHHSFSALELPVVKILTTYKWYLFERFGGDHIKEEKHGFGVAAGEVVFTVINGKLKVDMTVVTEKITRLYKGAARFAADGSYLYIIAGYDGKKATLSLKLAEMDKEHQTLIFGHFTYHSSVYKHLLTKTVILQRKDQAKQELSIGEHRYEGDEYKKIDKTISRFLYPRPVNRLSLPEQINNMGDLEKFLDKMEKPALKTALPHFEKKYYVYYKDEDENRLCEDELTIELNHEKRYYEGRFTHYPDEQKENTKIYLGQAFDNRGTILVLELNEYAGLRKQDEDPILLSCHLSSEKINWKVCQCLPGLISGLQDTSRIPVSYICLLVRQDAEGFKR
ncbi:MAG TPA: hypothetical protein VI233_05070, partial [Puia sp.]